MRATTLLRQAGAASSDPNKYHRTINPNSFWEKFRKVVVVNPEHNTGAPIVDVHRYPEPGSRPEKFSVPSSKASDIAANPYHLRDFRRMYPKTEVLTQSDLATLLIAQGGIASLPAPSLALASPTTTGGELTHSASAPTSTLSAIYSAPTVPSSGTFKPPTPPGAKFKWGYAEEQVPSGEHFPMWMANSQKVA